MRYKGLDLNLLHALDVLLDLRNVSRAADRLGLSQSAVSAALARLRQYFGDELLILDGRRMHATPFAEQMVEPLRIYLNATDSLLSSTRPFDPAATSRTFRIIASDYVVAAVLVRLAERLAHEAPLLRFEFISPDEGSLERLKHGTVDLMISPRDYLLESHPTEDIYEESIVVAGWNENPVFERGLTEDDFFAAGHVAVAIGSHRETTFADKYMRSLDRDRRIEAVVSSFTLVPWMLRGTMRLALMHERLAQVLSHALPIAYTPVPFAFPTMWEVAQYHRTRSSDNGLRYLIDQIRMTARQG